MSVIRELITKIGFDFNNEGAKKYEDTFSKLKETAIRAAEILGVVELGKKLLEAGGRMEEVTMSFETALGSADKAKEFMEQLGQFSMKTGFNKDELEDYSKQLIYMGMSTEKILPTMKMLGDLSVGVGKDKLPILVEAIGKMQQTGKVESRNFMAIMSAGIPILEQLHKQTGMNIDEIRKMGNAGTLNYKDVEKALQSLTGAGGKFDNLLEKQSMTFNGMVNRFKNMFGEMAEQMGGKILPIVKELGFGIMTWLGTNWNKIQEIFVKVLSIIAYGLGFAKGLFDKLTKSITGTTDIFGIILEVVDSFLTGLKALMPIIMPIVTAIGLLTAAQWLLNLALDASPWGLIKVGIVVLISLVGLIIKNWSKIGAFFKKLWTDIKTAFKNALTFIWKLFDNKLIQTLMAVFLPFIGIPIMVIKNWSKIKDFFGKLVEGIKATLQPFIDWITGIWDKVSGFFGGKKGEMNINNTSKSIPGSIKAGAPAKQNTFNIDSTVSIGVPEGTPAAQQQIIKTQVNKAISDSWQNQLRNISAQTPKTNFSGVTP